MNDEDIRHDDMEFEPRSSRSRRARGSTCWKKREGVRRLEHALRPHRQAVRLAGAT